MKIGRTWMLGFQMFLHHLQFFWEIRSHMFHKMTEIVFYESLIGHVCYWRDSTQWAMASSFLRFLDHTQQRITVGRTHLDEWSARRKDLYLTTHNTHYTDIQAPGGIRTHNLSRRAAADLRLRPRGQWDRSLIGHTSNLNIKGDVGTYHSVFIPISLLSILESFQFRTFSRENAHGLLQLKYCLPNLAMCTKFTN